VYRSRFCKGEANYHPLQWKDIRSAATESARKSSVTGAGAGAKEGNSKFVKGSPEEAKRLFLRNRLENTLAMYNVPAGAFFRAIDIDAPDWDLHTFTDYSPSVSVKQGDGSWLTVQEEEGEGEVGVATIRSLEGDSGHDGATGSGTGAGVDPEQVQLLADLRRLRLRMESKDRSDFVRAPDVIIHLSVLERSMPRALGVCLKETEEVILKTIPVLRKDEERKKASRERMLKENPRRANPTKRRRGPKKTAVYSSSGASGATKSVGEEEGEQQQQQQQQQQRRKWTPGGPVKVPSYMDQPVSTEGDSNWV
jgi:hypothetical protein